MTRHGRKIAVVPGYEAWQQLNGSRPSFAELLLNFPDVGDIARDLAPPRDLDL